MNKPVSHSSAASVTEKRAKARTSMTKTTKGQEVWRVSTDGHSQTIVTSASSVAAMDEAVVLYEGALQRLAQR